MSARESLIVGRRFRTALDFVVALVLLPVKIVGCILVYGIEVIGRG